MWGRSGHQVAEEVVSGHEVGLAIHFHHGHKPLVLRHPQQPLAGDPGLLFSGGSEAPLTELCEGSLCGSIMVRGQVCVSTR